MKLAVTYDDGLIFQHFGRTETFKIYEIEDGVVKTTDVIGTNGAGHEALADFLAAEGVNALICGGMGEGAQAALRAAGIEILAGVEGFADAAVDAYLRGELEASDAVNCDHHDEEDEEGGCGGGCGGSCGGGCGGCGGSCGGPSIEGPNVGKTVLAHYRGTFNDGTEFDSSYNRGEPLRFICGAGMMIPGFDQAVATMVVGESVDVHLNPEDAYGEYNPQMVLKFEIAKLPGSEKLNVGEKVYLYDNRGNPVPVTVLEKDEETITLDANHEMAGKELNFHIELVDIEESV